MKFIDNLIYTIMKNGTQFKTDEVINYVWTSHSFNSINDVIYR